MPRRHLCALLSFVCIATLQTWPAAAASPEAGQRQLSQERWMLHRDGARTSRRPEVRVHFFNPNQVVRISRQGEAAPAVRPIVRMSRPAPAPPARLLVVAAIPSPQPMAVCHEERPQPEVRSGR